jgi:hypothetical protein
MLASRHADSDRFVALRHVIQPPVRGGTLLGTFTIPTAAHASANSP